MCGDGLEKVRRGSQANLEFLDISIEMSFHKGGLMFWFGDWAFFGVLGGWWWLMMCCGMGNRSR